MKRVLLMVFMSIQSMDASSAFAISCGDFQTLEKALCAASPKPSEIEVPCTAGQIGRCVDWTWEETYKRPLREMFKGCDQGLRSECTSCGDFADSVIRVYQEALARSKDSGMAYVTAADRVEAYCAKLGKSK